MINETKQRIEAYKAALPGIKERIVAVAVMLVVSITMMASASYAWITLSRAPEVSLLSTTVAANGNLEIALSNPEGEQPEESKVGDSAAAALGIRVRQLRIAALACAAASATGTTLGGVYSTAAAATIVR